MYDRVLYFLLVSSKYMSCDGSMHMFHNYFFDFFLPHLVGFKFAQTSYARYVVLLGPMFGLCLWYHTCRVPPSILFPKIVNSN
jgi:hypothetical protein